MSATRTALNDALWDQVADAAMGTCLTAGQLIAQFDLEGVVDSETIVDGLLDLAVERCGVCGWWDETCNLDNGVTAHDDCVDTE